MKVWLKEYWSVVIMGLATLLISVFVTLNQFWVTTYSVDGTISNKIFEPAHQETTMIAGKIPASRYVPDKWYIEITFTSPADNGSRIFKWETTREAYDQYKVGEKIPVNDREPNLLRLFRKEQ